MGKPSAGHMHVARHLMNTVLPHGHVSPYQTCICPRTAQDLLRSLPDNPVAHGRTVDAIFEIATEASTLDSAYGSSSGQDARMPGTPGSDKAYADAKQQVIKVRRCFPCIRVHLLFHIIWLQIYQLHHEHALSDRSFVRNCRQ